MKADPDGDGELLPVSPRPCPWEPPVPTGRVEQPEARRRGSCLAPTPGKRLEPEPPIPLGDGGGWVSETLPAWLVRACLRCRRCGAGWQRAQRMGRECRDAGAGLNPVVHPAPSASLQPGTGPAPEDRLPRPTRVSLAFFLLPTWGHAHCRGPLWMGELSCKHPRPHTYTLAITLRAFLKCKHHSHAQGHGLGAGEPRVKNLSGTCG